ncbi:RluA family pseudouridine synthase [Candidatus Collierbacteria bacterium]|nr:RluA family pseudouridine synthase [Candidatus Collierbacteria bacterium]
MINIPILYEDDYLMVINKPAGVVVNRVDTEKGETIQDWAEKRITIYDLRFTNDNSEFFSRSGIVHRLDKETSGCLIIAKTEEAFVDLQRQFSERLVKKEYLALVHGKVEPKEGTIKVPIARSHHDRDKFTVVAGGRKSETSYAVISHYSLLSTYYSFIRVFPKTGRTHQIRVHFKYFGHPLVSDEKYGGNIALEDRKWCSRIFLHAAKIQFSHPVAKDKVPIEADLPSDLEGVLKNLKPLI